jgi:hypothetical protein
MKKIIWLFLIAIPCILGSCSKTDPNADNLYVPTSADATSTATLEELQQGRILYINNCGSCHNLVSPDSYPASSWYGIMNSMAPKTSMNSSQVTLVTKYVTRGN